MSPIVGSLAGISAQAYGLFRATPVATGNFYSIATVTPTGSSGTVTFSSIPSTYTHLQLRIIARGTSSAGGFPTTAQMTINGDTTTGNYYSHYVGGNGANAIAGSAAGYAGSNILAIPNGVNTANVFVGAIIDLLDYNSTTKGKTIRSFSGADLNTAAGFPYSGQVSLSSGMWNPSTPAGITSITFTADPTYSTYFATGSSFALYGVK